jgi:hypothetical protein
MSTEAESPPPRGATAILAPAAPASALAQTFAIGAGAAVAAGIAAFFIPRAAAAPAAAAAAPPARTAAVVRRNRPGLAPDDRGSDRRVLTA